MAKIRRITASEIPRSGSAAARQHGLRAFQNGRFDEAIRLWSPLAERDEQARLALAEAHFRRALKLPREARLDDLRRAAALAPDDMRYQYHLGMQQQHAGDLPAAIACYRTVLDRGGPRGAALLLLLARLEQHAGVDLATLPGSTPEARALLAPAQALLSGRTPPDLADGDGLTLMRRALGSGPSAAEAVAQLWRGLGQIGAGDSSAAATLDDSHALPNARLTNIRRSYLGVALARAGDLDAALALWQKVYASGGHTAALFENLAAALHSRLGALNDAGDLEGAAALALSTTALPLANAALNEARIHALDRAAHAAATAGNWARATELWEGARQIVGANQGLGSPRPLWHNLALAYEAQDRWLEAAEAWRGMLRTRPRRSAEPEDGLSAAQWAWVRKRVIECYKHAGQPGEAVTIFRQMIKAEPNDLELRLQLADALLANQQEQAAHNEVQRILSIDPSFADAQARHATLLAARGYLPMAEQVLRDGVAQHPERADLRRQFTHMLLDRVGHYVGHGMDAAAEPLLREGQQLDPENEQFPLNLARVRLNQRRIDEARVLLDRVLELAGDRVEPYINVFQCWAIEQDLPAARAVIERAEAALTPSADFYGQLGAMTIAQATPPPPMPNLFMPLTALPQQPPPVDTPWTAFGRELLDRAVQRRPGDARLHMLIASELLGARPDIAQHYADEAARLAPDETNMLILRGVLLGLNERKREAKEQLRKAANQARKRGEYDLAAQADSMRREIDNPLFRMIFQMKSLIGGMDDDELDDLF